GCAARCCARGSRARAYQRVRKRYAHSDPGRKWGSKKRHHTTSTLRSGAEQHRRACYRHRERAGQGRGAALRGRGGSGAAAGEPWTCAPRERGQNVVSEGADARAEVTRSRAKSSDYRGAEEGSRTPTPLRAEDFESSASASSATSARALA